MSNCPCPVKLSPGQRRCMDCPRCTCPTAYRSLGKLHGISLGKGWVRTADDPTCPIHGVASSARAGGGGQR